MKKIKLIMALVPLLGACTTKNSVELIVSNPADGASTVQMASVSAAPLFSELGASFVCVYDSAGNELPSQLTYDGQLIFPVKIAAGSDAAYTVLAADSMKEYKTVAYGRPYPERADDVAWENERVGFRVYGPATMNKGERAYGYDIFFKHLNEDPILPVLYKNQTDPDLWARADSLRAVDPKSAQEYIDSFTYHIDHGLGMDCYAVGPTLGNGVAAFIENDSILYAWCYDTAEVLDNGPLRFTVRLDFAPRAVGADSAVVEHRVISLDRGSYLNRQQTWFDGLGAPRRIGAGMPLREGGETTAGPDYVAVSDLTQGPDNGKALLGVIIPGSESEAFIQNHLLIYRNLAPADTLVHYWGFAWDREDFGSLDAWGAHLSEATKAIASPVEVKKK